jgi:Cu(I)/Ag(I) efflux system membrane protein CusA/SilA
LLKAPHEDDRQDLSINASQKALERFDETMRSLSLLRYQEFEQELAPLVVHSAVERVVGLMEAGGRLTWPADSDRDGAIAEIAASLTAKYGRWFVEQPTLEDATQLARDVAENLHEREIVESVSDSLDLYRSPLGEAAGRLREFFGGRPQSLFTVVFDHVVAERTRLWREQVGKVNWELFDRGTEAFTWYALEEVVKAADRVALVDGAEHAAETNRFAVAALAAQLGNPVDARAFPPFAQLREELEEPFRDAVFFWPRKTGPKGDLVDDEMGRVLQTPGWSNIFTQPIINRIEMLSTGVRTDIGVKVFGPDLETIDRVCKQVEAALKPVSGARDVIAAPIMGKDSEIAFPSACAMPGPTARMKRASGGCWSVPAARWGKPRR